MSTISDTGFPNLADWAKRQRPGGGIADIVNILTAKNPILDDIPFVSTNQTDGHKIVEALSLPSAAWRKYNEGVPATKATTATFTETVGMMEDESKVDVDLAKRDGNPVEYRASEDKLKKVGFGKQFATAVFYESANDNPERIHGLTPRMPGTSGFIASAYTLAGTNAGSNCHSVWLISWEPRKIYGLYPRGSQAGLMVEDKGEERVLDGNSRAFWAYITRMQWKVGIAVEDYRYMVRFQWDPDDAAFTDDDRGMYLAMQEMLGTIFELLPSTRFYMNRTSKKKLDAQLATNDANFLQYISPEGSSGMRIPTFMGVPIRVEDALVAETAIT